MRRLALNLTQTTHKQVKRQAKRDEIDLLPIIAFQVLQKRKVSEKLASAIYKETRQTEGKMKEQVLMEEVVDNQTETTENPKIFYLASRHLDSAYDHEDYQGKMYIDEQWKSVVKDDILRKRIEHYINLHQVKSYQWVIFEPVWLVTRPNCRHYFTALRVDEVLGRTPAHLLRKNYMIHRKGRRSMRQTIRHDMTRKTYSISEIESLLEKYKERLELHEGMAKVKDSHIIQKAIHKDKLLIKKWNEVLKKLNSV